MCGDAGTADNADRQCGQTPQTCLTVKAVQKCLTVLAWLSVVQTNVADSLQTCVTDIADIDVKTDTQDRTTPRPPPSWGGCPFGF